MKHSSSFTILGIETSCDETAAAVVCDGVKVCSNVIATSLKDHQRFGGLKPRYGKTPY
jgi:N6-L-threonylcarbamoyladenine synthase